MVLRFSTVTDILSGKGNRGHLGPSPRYIFPQVLLPCWQLSYPFPSHGVCIQVLEQVAALHTSSMDSLELLPQGVLEAGALWSVPPPWTVCAIGFGLKTPGTGTDFLLEAKFFLRSRG